MIETALRLSREQGFQATTMRRIASEAEASLGNAYYYFAGKDELVHELYIVVQRTSPFSVESSVARDMAIDLMRQVVDRSHQRPPSVLRQRRDVG